jgi:AraC family transcriptional regulator of arabinose operon
MIRIGKAGRLMQNYYDISIGDISIVIKKREKAEFVYRCKSRNKDGFIFVTDGLGTFENAEGCSQLQKNSLLILSKGEQYSVLASNDEFEYITTAFDISPDNAFNTIGLPTLIQLTEHPHFVKQIEWLLKLWDERSPLYVLKTKIQLGQLILDLFHLNTINTEDIPRENRILPAINYIHRFYDQKISVTELAGLCKLSVSHFRRVFKDKTGFTPLQYKESVRIYWAKQLLFSKLFTISEIAAKLGYYDIYHFSEDFKKNTQLSPKQYMQIHTEKRS